VDHKNELDARFQKTYAPVFKKPTHPFSKEQHIRFQKTDTLVFKILTHPFSKDRHTRFEKIDTPVFKRPTHPLQTVYGQSTSHPMPRCSL
jgi:hypothetical protein